MYNLAKIWDEVRHWPPEERRTLANHILTSLWEEESGAVSQERRTALQQLIGIWKSAQPPSDEDAERIVEEERMKKYG